jgi:hypothetical protein
MPLMMNNATAPLPFEVEQDLLFPKDHAFPCDDPKCLDRTVEINGRFKITGGHAGFNSTANNAGGYSTDARAFAASIRYQNRGRKPAVSIWHG